MRLQFPTSCHIATTYRTVYWGAIYHNGVEYANIGANVRGALERMTKLRLSEEPGADQELRDNQAEATESISWLRMLRFYASLLVAPLTTQLGIFEAIQQNAFAPHPKRAIRVPAWYEIVENAAFFITTTIKNIALSVKKFEWARVRKYARGVYDLTVVGSIYGGWITDIFKTTISQHDYVRNDCLFRFVKSATADALHSAFTLVSSGYWDMVYLAHSDDALIVIKHQGVLYYYDVDISSCESSHFSIFQSLYRLIPDDWWLKLLITQLLKQLVSNVKIENPSNPREFVILKVNTPILFSGTTLTTIINTMAHMLAYTILNVLITNSTSCDNTGEIMQAGRLAGYVFTVTRNTVLERATFLKTYHTIVDGEVRIAQALGVLFRTIGTCRGDFPSPHSGTLAERAGAYNQALISGFKHSGNTSVLRCMQEKWSGFKTVKLRREDVRYVELDIGSADIPDTALLNRYGATQQELMEFLELYRGCRPGALIRTHFSARVIQYDYSLEDSFE